MFYLWVMSLDLANRVLAGNTRQTFRYALHIFSSTVFVLSNFDSKDNCYRDISIIQKQSMCITKWKRGIIQWISRINNEGYGTATGHHT